MLKFLFAALLLATPAGAVPSLPPGEPEMQDPLATLQKLDRDLEAARVVPKTKSSARLEDFREDLQLSANGFEVEMEKIPPAPEGEEGTPRK